jgi:hypothetical protein
MRYMNVENINFTTVDNKIVVIKGKRPIPDYNIVTTIQKDEKELLDEIATKEEIYGEGNESLSYLLFEANQKEIVEVDFDLTKIKYLKIPVTE